MLGTPVPTWSPQGTAENEYHKGSGLSHWSLIWSSVHPGHTTTSGTASTWTLNPSMRKHLKQYSSKTDSCWQWKVTKWPASRSQSERKSNGVTRRATAWARVRPNSGKTQAAGQGARLMQSGCTPPIFEPWAAHGSPNMGSPRIRWSFYLNFLILAEYLLV